MSDSRMAVIGDKDIVQLFGAVGADVYFTDTKNAETIVHNIANKYDLILVDGNCAIKHLDEPYPIILEIQTCKEK